MRPFRFFSDNLDETLFEHRNKEYGAYELRKSYHTRVLRSFSISLSFIAILFGTPVLIEYFSEKPKPNHETYTTLPLKLEQKIIVEQTQKQIDPVISPTSQKNVVDPTFQVIPDSLLSKETDKKDTIQKSVDLTASINNNTNNGDTNSQSSSKDTTSSGGTPGGSGATLVASSLPYSMAAVDITPKFPGGDPSMVNFLQKNIHYNERAKEAGVSGKVYASFIINSKGEVEAIKIIRSLGFGLDEEVVRVLGIMPKWIPGSYKGKPVSTILNLPVSFNLVQ